MKSRLKNKIPQFRQSKTLFRNFIIVSLVFLTLLTASTITIYTYAKKTIQAELTHTNENMVRNVTQSVDSLIKDMQYITSSLSLNSMVQFFFQTENSHLLFDGFEDRITEQINAYVYGFEYIDSIYIFSEKYQSCITSSGRMRLRTLRDKNWIPLLDEMEEDNGLFIRKMGDIYPFVLSVIHREETASGTGYVVLNLNLRKLPNVLESNIVSNVYLINENEQLIYQKMQDDILEPITDYPELNDYRLTEELFSNFHEMDSPFIYSQNPSEYYPWSYVTITHLHEYSQQLNELRSTLILAFSVLLVLLILLAFLLSIIAYSPILRLTKFLNNPANWDSASDMDEKDIQNIVQKVTAYAQANSRLSHDLEQNLLALKSTQMVALQSQINPHFMVNTLNLIYCSAIGALGSQHLVSRMTFYLGRLMGYSLDSAALVTLEEELYNTECYLKILQARYSNQISVSISLEENTRKIQVPKLILQPLIENCVYHGIKDKIEKELRIEVSVSLCLQPPDYFSSVSDTDCSNVIQITVSDNGIGMPAEKVTELKQLLRSEISLSSDHVGLKNVISRLYLLYGKHYFMDLESTQGSGTCVNIYLLAGESGQIL